MPQQILQPEKKAFDWKELLKPSTRKLVIFFVLLVMAGVLIAINILRGEIADFCPTKPEPFSWSFTSMLLLPIQIALQFKSLGDIVFVLLGLSLLFELIYLYSLACAISIHPYRSLIAFAIIYYVVAIAVLIMPQPDCPPSANHEGVCKALLIINSKCSGQNGTWNPDACGTTGCAYSQGGVPEGCSKVFEGTSRYKDPAHFQCGLNPV